MTEQEPCEWPDCADRATAHVQHPTLGWISVCARHQAATYRQEATDGSN